MRWADDRACPLEVAEEVVVGVSSLQICVLADV
jgi:hypothetical protein